MIHCPTCDAGLRFEIETQQMVCDHCSNHFDVDAVGNGKRVDAGEFQSLDLYIFTCPDCGAELAVNSENDAVGFCPYCGGESMLFSRIKKTWVPDEIIPFKITKEQCKEAYVKEVRKHPFVSRKYRDSELIESFRGIYMPYWRFEGKQQEPYRVQGTETVDSENAGYKIRRTYEQWYDIDYTITGFSHDASSQFDDHISEHLAPYHEEQIKPFSPGYLSGFYAEISDMDQETYTRYAQERCQDFTASKLPFEMTIEERREIQTDIKSLSNALYPVWFMSYRRKGKKGDKISYAAVNGETGKVSADLPLSPLRIVATALVLTAALFVLFNILMAFLPSIKAPDLLTLCAVIALISAGFLNESFLGTLSQSLRLGDEPTVNDNKANAEPSISFRIKPLGAESSLKTFCVSLAVVLGIVLIVTDGSYQGSLRFMGQVLCFIGALYLLPWIFNQVRYERSSKGAIMSAKTSQLENGIVDAYTRYEKLFIILRAIIAVTCLVALFLGITGAIDRYICYAFCILLAIEILAYAIVQIVFQTTIAERKPPQMSKEGAFYDAN